MVSPSKKRKLEARIQTKPTPAAALSTPAVTGDCRLRRSKKPLSEKKFYLDLKNHGTAVKIEARLRSLGATVEAFLAKEVSYVVTDRPEWSANVGGVHQRQQSTSQWLASPLQTSASPATIDCPGDSLAGKRKILQRSRAEAMLEKARQQHTHLNTIDPLENAIRWGVSIWPLDKVLKWLDKIEHSLNGKFNNIPVKTRSFKTPFIKFEDITRKYRPVYSTFSVWPTLNLDCEDCVSPFSVPKSPLEQKSPLGQETKSARNATQAMLEQPQCDQRMTRKSRIQPLRNEEPVKAKLHPGFCEICAVDFLDIEQHLNSSSHVKFVQDSKNYQDLDSLIKEGPTVEELLKAIDPIGCSTRRSPRGPASPPWSASDSVSDSLDTIEIMRRPALCNGQLRRTSQRQAEEKIKALARKETCEVFMNGTGKKQSCKHNDRYLEDDRNCGEITHNLRSRLAPAEDAGFRRLRSRNSEGSASVEGSSDSTDSSKLDTYNDVDAHCSTRSKTEPARTRRGRNSSGSESNLRLKRDNEDHTADGINGKQGSYSEEDTLCSLSNTRCNRVKGKFIKKKRLSVEEKLLEDNKEYYKLEVINAKLRSSGYFCNQRESNMPEDLHTSGHANDDSDLESGGHKDEAASKIKRPRRSELSRLNDEADNYLFGDKSIKKEGNSPIYQNPNRSPLQLHIYADECANHVPSAPLGERSSLAGIKEEAMSPRPHDDGPLCSPSDPERKKRRSQAEAFIHDNLDYYKFPLSESRLRLHSASNPHSPDKTEIEEGGSPKYTAPPSCSRDANSVGHIPNTKNEENLFSKSESNTFSYLLKVAPEAMDRMRFSFESIPKSEPWFQTYARQDEGEEMVEPYSDFLFERRVKLPYELSNDFFGSRFLRGRGIRGRGRGQSRGRLKIMPRSRAMQLVAQARLPRKSPRCHASTLAILSSFGSKRRKSLGLPPDFVPVQEPVPENASDFQEIEKKVEEMLASPPSSPIQETHAKSLGRVRRRSQRRVFEGSKEALDTSDHEPLQEAEPMDADNPVNNVADFGLKSNSEVDVVNLVGDFPKCQCIEDLQSDIQQNGEEDAVSAAIRNEMESECASSTYDTVSEAGTNYSTRGKLKKRKRNMTGWPSTKPKKKRLEVEPTENFVGVRIKRTPVKTCGKVRMEYRATSYRGRGRRGMSSNRGSSSVSRTQTQSESQQEESPDKPSHSNSWRAAVAGTSKDTGDESRNKNVHSSSQSISRSKTSPRKSQTRSTRWGSLSLRQRR